MRNICFFNSIIFWGGGEKLHLENAVAFKEKGYNVFLFSDNKAPLWEKAKEHNIKAYPISVGNLSFLNPIKIITLIRYYRKLKIDTVVFSSSQDLKTGSISAKLAGVKNIVYLRGLAVPIKVSLLNRIIFKSILTHIIPNSEETKRTILKNMGQYISPKKIKTIYHGINLEEYSNAEHIVLPEIKEKGHGVILGNAGRLTPQKGQKHLIEVAKKIKDSGIDFTLFIAGTGELEDELQDLINTSGLEHNVVLLGFVEDMQNFMYSIDVFLLSSIWEGFGFVLVEAMIKAKPVVAFDITSNPEIIDVDSSGFIVDFPDIDAFANKTMELMRDESLRSKMGKKGLEYVHKNFILKDRIDEIEHYLNN